MKAKLGALVSEVSGKLGGSVFQGSQSGLMLRSGRLKTGARKSSFPGKKINYRQIVSNWRSISDSDRLSWDVASPVRLSGFQFYLSVNMKRLASHLFIANNFKDSARYVTPAVWIQGNWAATLGTGHAMVETVNGYVVCAGGSGYMCQRAPLGSDAWVLTGPIHATFSCFSIVRTSANTLIMGGSVANSIFRSIDHGSTWTQIALGFSMTVIQSIILSRTGSVMLVGSANNHLYESTNDGLTFLPVSTFAPLTGGSYLRATNDGGLLLIGTGAGKVLRSVDNGLTWLDVTPPVVTTSFAFVVVAYDNVVLTLDVAQAHYWRSVDYGKTWVKNPYSIPAGYVLLRNPAFNGVLFGRNSVSNKLCVSYDLGLSWTDLFVPTYSTRPNNYFMASDGCIYVAGFTNARPMRGYLVMT